MEHNRCTDGQRQLQQRFRLFCINSRGIQCNCKRSSNAINNRINQRLRQFRVLYLYNTARVYRIHLVGFIGRPDHRWPGNQCRDDHLEYSRSSVGKRELRNLQRMLCICTCSVSCNGEYCSWSCRRYHRHFSCLCRDPGRGLFLCTCYGSYGVCMDPSCRV